MKRVLGILLLSLVIVPLFPGGQAESGRVAAMDMVGEGTFVAEAFLDEESFLDDYRLEHTPAPDAALSVFMDVDKPLVFHWGDVVTLQISVATTDESFYPAVPFSYVLFFNDPESLEDENTVAAIAATLNEILDQKKPEQRLYVFLQQEERVEELSQGSNLTELLDKAKTQAQRTNPERALESMLTVGQAINDSGIKKYLWILGKPVADSKADIQDVKYLIAAYGSTSTEISFCGYDESFRPETVNRIVRQYGGNSYYISNPQDLPGTIRKDFKYYQKPAISDLVVSVHAVGASAQRAPVRTYTQRSMGPEEHHTFLVQMEVPSRSVYHNSLPREEGEQEEPDLPNSYPLAFATYQFYNHVTGKIEYGADQISVSYEDDYTEYRLSTNPLVVKNIAIVGTAQLLKQVALLLQSRRFEEALIVIRDHVKRLETVNRTIKDPLVEEDIATLNKYKALIAEQKKNPVRGAKIFLDLGRRKY
jgi:hypothetical protein